MEEIWKPVHDWEDYYEVSNLGNLRRREGSPGRYKVQRPLKQFELKRPDGGQGYLTCRFKAKSKGQKTLYVHRIVCAALHGPAPSERHQCCHNDGDKHNNRAENLRWDTKSANEMDRVKHGTSNRGSRHGLSKLSEEQVHEIRRLLAAGYRQQEIADRFGVSQAAIYDIHRGRRWAHL